MQLCIKIISALLAGLRLNFELRGIGFAAGCEARLCRAAHFEILSGLCPRFGLSPAVWPKAGPEGIAHHLGKLDGAA